MGAPYVFMNLLTDFAFKKVFGSDEHKNVLIRFLNILFEKDGIHIDDVRFHDKEVLPPDSDGKRIIYDVYCTTGEGREHIILEMQQLEEERFTDRALYYTARVISGQGRAGWQYFLRPVYSIFILNFSLRGLPPKVTHDIRLTDVESGIEFSDRMRMLFIQLPQIPSTWEACKTPYEKILFLMKNIHTMDKKSKPYESGEFSDLFDASEIGSLAAEDVVRYSESYAKLEADRRAIAYAAECAGNKRFEEGLEQGMQQGKKEEKIQIARKLLAKGMSRDEIMEITGVDINCMDTFEA